MFVVVMVVIKGVVCGEVDEASRVDEEGGEREDFDTADDGDDEDVADEVLCLVSVVVVVGGVFVGFVLCDWYFSSVAQ